MRTIKFRAWLTNGARMLSVIDCRFSSTGICYLTLLDRNGAMYSTNDVHECEIMQFTGLLDKNSKDIYEGDIVKLTNLYGKTFIGQVQWGRLSSSMNTWDNGETWLLHFAAIDRDGPLYPYCQQNTGYDIAVIGNIHEHPDVLKVETR